MIPLNPVFIYIIVVGLVVAPFVWYLIGYPLAAIFKRIAKMAPNWSISKDVVKLTEKGDSWLISAGIYLLLWTLVWFITLPRYYFGFLFSFGSALNRRAMMREEET